LVLPEQLGLLEQLVQVLLVQQVPLVLLVPLVFKEVQVPRAQPVLLES
jgi:hypothetical protein